MDPADSLKSSAINIPYFVTGDNILSFTVIPW